MGALLGDELGSGVGASKEYVGAKVGMYVGLMVGEAVGCGVGAATVVNVRARAVPSAVAEELMVT